ncbi:MgtC/SapB family protein [Konateibacter massiliensis]|uniref:MgtC/SapB family protein n=1 Tax=Konateibacter massiliensis TaxID=2002841 RepID=UPI000C15D575|nr:MgtC/SapB family protein [Konateibacter massiliensis]
MWNGLIGIFHYLEEFNMVSVTIRLVLSVILGGVIGMERATKRSAAGLRTFALVSLGACLAMITNQYLLITSGITGDPSRMGAQVISGIGFLGVGTIIVTGKNHVKGLTTAASLWTTATMGIAIGAGFIYGGVVAFILIMISIRLLLFLSRRQEDFNPIITMDIEINKVIGFDSVMNYLKEHSYVLCSIEKKKQKAILDEDFVVLIEFDLGKRISHQEILEEMRHVEGVNYVEEIR